MTKRFWLHVSLSAALAVAAGVFVWLRGTAAFETARAPEAPAVRGAVLVLAVAFLFFFARLLLRSTGSDRTMGLLGLHAVVLYPPFILFASSSPAQAAALLLLTAAFVEALDADLARANAIRSGLFASAACLIERAAIVPAAALLPVVLAVTWPRLKITALFTLALSIPWAVSTWILGLGGRETLFLPLRQSASPADLLWWMSALSGYARFVRSALEGGFLSPYAALALTALVVATARRMGPSRRCTTALVWLLAVFAVSSVLFDDRSASLLLSFQYLLLVVLANMGLAALAAMNPLHAGRRRMIPVTAFFLLPPIVAWVKILM